MRRLLFAAALAALGSPAAAETKTFKDWTAACGEEGPELCTAEAGAADAVRLVLERTGSDARGWLIAVVIPGHGLNPERPLAFKPREGESVAVMPGEGLKAFREADRYYVTDAAALGRLLPLLLKEEYVLVEYFDVTGELRSTPVSLDGLTASLLWIEEAQGAVGEGRVAVAPEGLPEAGTTDAAAVEEAGVPEAVLGQHMAGSACEDPQSELMKGFQPIITPLSPAAILYAVPCTAGAYNIAYRLYIRERGEIGGVQTLYFPTYSKAYGWGGTDLLFNVDAEGTKLTAFYKGRGLGDCGTLASFTFVDFAYRLDEFRAQEECEGRQPEAWPVVYKAGTAAGTSSP